MRTFAVIALGVAANLCAFGGADSANAADSRFTVVLDPGHGGRDLGTSGRSNHEKAIVLKVAQRVREILEHGASDSVRVVMTRTSDEFIPLRDRARIANDAEADMFVSIHINSLPKRSRGRENISGASVYALGLHKSEANLEVAMAENAVIELEEDYTEAYQGFDPNLSESYIIFELSQNRNMEASLEMAELIQNNLVSMAGRADREVRQAGFLVLWATKMPAVLVELDFMCNPRVERFLASREGIDKMARAIATAIDDYRRVHPRLIHH